MAFSSSRLKLSNHFPFFLFVIHAHHMLLNDYYGTNLMCQKFPSNVNSTAVSRLANVIRKVLSSMSMTYSAHVSLPSQYINNSNPNRAVIKLHNIRKVLNMTLLLMTVAKGTRKGSARAMLCVVKVKRVMLILLLFPDVESLQ